jgi:hypothetical protein
MTEYVAVERSTIRIFAKFRLRHATRRNLSLVAAYVLALVCLVCGGNPALGQECPHASATGPDTASQVRTLKGRLVFHDGIRQWLELKLDEPQCGESSIQLMQIQQKSTQLEVFRDCRVKSSGPLDDSPTGYYSLNIFQDVEKIEPVGGCVRQPPLPDYSGAKPDKGIHAYRVAMHVIYTSEDRPIIFHVWSAGRELRPWQAYASYWLTGGFVLYGLCGEGFVIDKVFGTPEAKPGHFDDPRTPEDMAEFNPEGAASSGRRDLHLGYTCIRVP